MNSYDPWRPAFADASSPIIPYPAVQQRNGSFARHLILQSGRIPATSFAPWACRSIWNFDLGIPWPLRTLATSRTIHHRPCAWMCIGSYKMLKEVSAAFMRRDWWFLCMQERARAEIGLKLMKDCSPSAKACIGPTKVLFSWWLILEWWSLMTFPVCRRPWPVHSIFLG